MGAFMECEHGATEAYLAKTISSRLDSPPFPRWGLALFLMLFAFASITPAAADASSVAEARGISLDSEEPESDVQDREVISLILGLAALPLLAIHWKRLVRFPGAPWWIASLLTREVAWIVTVLESFFWPDVLDMAEHIFLTVSTILAAIGACILFHRTTKEPRPTT